MRLSLLQFSANLSVLFLSMYRCERNKSRATTQAGSVRFAFRWTQKITHTFEPILYGIEILFVLGAFLLCLIVPFISNGVFVTDSRFLLGAFIRHLDELQTPHPDDAVAGTSQDRISTTQVPFVHLRHGHAQNLTGSVDEERYDRMVIQIPQGRARLPTKTPIKVEPTPMNSKQLNNSYASYLRGLPARRRVDRGDQLPTETSPNV